ncbi:MAG: hypothetical protein EPO16_07720 [Dehalococcoidia bacterium]|nr:MAG: hypothetical protein EPO16_07720 [Dehalococcoidia bacterium]
MTGAGIEADPGTLVRMVTQPDADPERILLVIRRVEDGALLLARWPDAPRPVLLSLDTPHPDEGFAGGVARLVRARFAVTVRTSRLHARRLPVRMRHPAKGGETVGFLRVAAVEVSGEPSPDGALAGVEAFPPAEAARALSTDLERRAFALGLELLG